MSTSNYLVIEKQKTKWWRAKEIVGIFTLFYLLIKNSGQIDPILITLILYFSIMVLLDHKSNLEISDMYIANDGQRINFNSVRAINIEQNHIVINETDDILGDLVISLDGIDSGDKELIKRKLIKIGTGYQFPVADF